MTRFLTLITLALLIGASPAPRFAQGSLEDVRQRIERAGSAQEQIDAIRTLSRIRSSPARRFLLELLDEIEAPAVRAAVYRQLRFHQHADVLGRLRADFAERSNEVELDAIAAGLGGQGNKGKAVLISALRSERVAERSAAVGGLRGLTGDRSVFEALMKAFRAGSSAFKIEVINAVNWQQDDKRFAAMLMEASRDDDQGVRTTAFRRMQGVSSHDVFAVLKAAFGSPTGANVLRAVAYGLSGHGRAGLEILIEGLGSESESVRDAALLGLAWAGESQVTTRALIEAFHDAPARAQENILSAMSTYEATSAITRLRIDALEAESPGTRAEALFQLAASGFPRTRQAVLALAEDPAMRRTPHDKARMLYALGVVVDRETFGLFLELSASVDGWVISFMRQLLEEDDSRVLTMFRREGLQREDEGERFTVVSILAAIETAETSALLVSAIEDLSARISTTAMRALANRGDQRIVPFLRDALADGDDDERLIALSSLHDLLGDRSGWAGELLELVREDREPIRFVALDLLADLGYRPALEIAHALMDSESWRMRSVVYDFCRRVRDVSSIPLLIVRLEKENGRLFAEATAALTSLLGRNYKQASQWRQWWNAVGADFELPPPPREQGLAQAAPGVMTYHGIPVTSKAVYFLVDVSGSMSTEAGTGGITRLKAAKDALNSVLDHCAPDFMFNIVPFSDQGRAWQSSLTEASDGNKELARGHVRAFRATGGTNVHDALKLAFDDPSVDTIYLLSDGLPSSGVITDQNALADEVQFWNLDRRIVINTISIGTASVLMQRLAAESGGTFVRRL